MGPVTGLEGGPRLTGEASEEQRLRRACQSMESTFFQILLKEMWRPAAGSSAGLHQAMYVEHLADHMVAAGGIGLADTIYRHLARTLNDTALVQVDGEPLPAVAADQQVQGQ